MDKNLLHIVFILFLSTQLLVAQQIIEVMPGAGTLENAINNSNAGDVLQLTGGAEYLLSLGKATTFGIIDKTITIQTNQEHAQKAIIRLSPDASPTKKFYFFTIKDGAALTLKGLEIHGIAKDTAVASSMIIFDSRPNPAAARIGNFHFEDCIFRDFKDYIVHGMKDDYARGMIQDTVFVNNLTVYRAKHFLQYKHVSLKHIEMTNSTIYSLQGMALKIGKIGYRCVLLNPTTPYIPLTDSTITPTGFIDRCTMDDLGDIHGHVQVDNAFHTLTVSNSILSNQQQWSQPAIYFLEPMTEKVIAVENTNFWQCGPPNELVGGNQWIGYEFKDSMNINPGYRDAAAGDFTLAENSPLLTAGTDGGPIGDPRWVQNLSGNSNLQVPDKIMNIYPNPFRNKTNIAYTVNENAFVSIVIYNLWGEMITSLKSEYMSPGNYVSTWVAGTLLPGIYICSIAIGNKNENIKIVHQ